MVQDIERHYLLKQIVILKEQKLLVDLIIFEMPDFDMILRMNFLSRYGAEIDCKRKKVRFRLDTEDKLMFGEDWVLNMMISSVKAQKMLNKGCARYLAFMSTKVEAKMTSSVDDTQLVYKFLNVFLDNLRG